MKTLSLRIDRHAVETVATCVTLGALGWLLSYGEVRAQDSAQAVISTKETSKTEMYGRIDADLASGNIVANPKKQGVERAFLDLTLPNKLDSTYVDRADLVLRVSTEFDSTEPLIIAAFPATAPPSELAQWSSDWTEMSGGFDPEHIAIAPLDTSAVDTEIHLDITEFVRLWRSGVLPNYGLVIKSLSENKSTFHWIRDGRYNGQDAKLEVTYSR
jgi:hypothetical protein